MNTPKFALGSLVATPGALEALGRAGQSPAEFLARHAAGDWGEVERRRCPAQQRRCDVTVSACCRPTGQPRATKLWIITEADRSSTCILLPGEY